MTPPYPFGPAYTLKKFINQACNDYSCEYFESERKLVGPDGKMIFIQELKHDVVMEPDVLRTYCNLLGLPSEKFDAHLSMISELG